MTSSLIIDLARTETVPLDLLTFGLTLLDTFPQGVDLGRQHHKEHQLLLNLIFQGGLIA